MGSPLQVWVAGLKAQIYSNLTISLGVESLCVQADRSGSSRSLTNERVAGRKAVGLQMVETGFQCQVFFLSLCRPTAFLPVSLSLVSDLEGPDLTA